MASMRAVFTTLALLSIFTVLVGQVIAVPAPTAESLRAPYPSQDMGVPIRNHGAKNTIPNKYIVVYGDEFDDDTVGAHQAYWAATIARRNIGKRSLVDNRLLNTNVHTFTIGALRAMALEADDTSAIEINSADEVSYIEADTYIHINNAITQQDATTGLARMSSSKPGATSYIYHDSAGEGITAFIVDTGIMTDHEEFEGRAVLAFNSVDDADTDESGHGSHVAGTIGGKTFGVAKRATLVGVKVMGQNGLGSLSSTLAGLDFVYQTVRQRRLSGKSVMNLSLDGDLSQALNKAIDTLRAEGVVPVVSAGNDNTDAGNSSPSSAPGAITVGAIDQTTDQRAWFSNFGPHVDVFAPGVNVESVGIHSTTDTRILNGTSMASPHVAGLAAYLMALENITSVDDVEARVTTLAAATGSQVHGNVKGTAPWIANNGMWASAHGETCLVA
ncbi:hypothetical protein SLS53_008508 [Cytospora paraplurivora]|uniref:Peptidase S8/S53 domain-containing protein n=1 Tax=Cytospora paraplurivora TaxID=2898453 RepID=A0AAN9TZ02_9PEZI